MDYSAQLTAAIDRLHVEGRYRTFIDIARTNGQYPYATWHRPDGSTESERFATEATFRARLESIEEALKSDHWNINGSPQILSAGWKDGVTKSKMN